MKEIPAEEIPELKDTTSTVEKKKIGATKRSPVKRRKIAKGEGKILTPMNDNFMNVSEDLIESSLGMIQKNFKDGARKFFENMDTPTFSIMSNTGSASEEYAINLYKNGQKFTAFTKGNASLSDAYVDLAAKLDAINASVGTTIYPGDAFISVEINASNLFDDIDYSDNICIGSLFTDVVSTGTASGSLHDLVSENIVDQSFQPISLVSENNTEQRAIGVARRAFTLASTGTRQCLEFVTGIDPLTLFSVETDQLRLVAMPWIKLDDEPVISNDYLLQRSSGYDAENKVATGASNTSLINARGSAKITIPNDADPMFEVDLVGSKVRDIKPMLDDDSDATEAWKEACRTHGVRMPRATFPQETGICPENPIVSMEFTGTPAGTVSAIKFMLNGVAYVTAITAGTATTDIATAVRATLGAIDDITAGGAASTVTVQYKNNSIPLKISNFDFGTITGMSSVSYTTDLTPVGFEFSDCTTGDGFVRVYVNGMKFELPRAGGDPGDDTASSLADLINNSDYFYADAGGTATLDIYSVDGREPIYTVCEIEEVTAPFDLAILSSVLSHTPQAEYDDVVSDVYFDHVRIGTNTSNGSGCDMVKFCETANIGINLDRTINDIGSVCNEDHRIGFSGKDYTIDMDLEVTDIDAVGSHRRWKQFEESESFPLYFVSSNTGIVLFFPACRFEELNKEDINGNHGTKYKVNINFDPNKIPVICLPQTI